MMQTLKYVLDIYLFLVMIMTSKIFHSMIFSFSFFFGGSLKANNLRTGLVFAIKPSQCFKMAQSDQFGEIVNYSINFTDNERNL